tara:strand:- start:76216 stop:76524 length:309 start_codon:yes stop_codon:yes gene_type:complete
MELNEMYYMYLMANAHRTVIYTGKTTDLQRRVLEHKLKLSPKSFTARYNVNQLVHFEAFETNEEASQREHQIKAGSRKKKIDLIERNNPDWKDFSDGWGSFG